jgi:DNA polymerase-3 subunit gamma/tau
MSQALYRKWRPQQWGEVIGQKHIVQTLQNAVKSNRVGHAYLFSGPRGTGKTTSARLLAKAVNCLHEDLGQRPCNECEHCLAINEARFMDLIEIDAASNTSVDDIRELRDKINFSPSQGRFKVYLIDEVHMLSTAAFNALLKTLEEPPAHAIFILATTEVHKIPATVLSRCQRHEFRRIAVNEIVEYLRQKANYENIQIADDALTLIARQSTGAMRDAISLLDQLSSTGEEITLEKAQLVLGTATNQRVIELVNAILTRQPADGLDSIHAALDSGSDPRQFARQVVEYLRGLLLIRFGNADQIEATNEQREIMIQHANAFHHQQLLDALKQFNDAAVDLKSGWQPGLLLEMALAQSIEFRMETTQFSTFSVQQTPVVPQTQSATQKPTSHTEEPVKPKKKSSIFGPSLAPTTQPSDMPGMPKPIQAADTQQHAVDLTAAEIESTQSPAHDSYQHPDPEPSAMPVDEIQETAPTHRPTGKEITLNMVSQSWREIRKILRDQSKRTEALFNSCKPIMVKDGTLILGTTSDILKSKMEMPENLDLTRQVIAHIFGQDVPIKITVLNADIKNDPSELGIESDSMVGTAINLGGEIVQKDEQKLN